MTAINENGQLYFTFEELKELYSLCTPELLWELNYHLNDGCKILDWKHSKYTNMLEITLKTDYSAYLILNQTTAIRLSNSEYGPLQAQISEFKVFHHQLENINKALRRLENENR